MGEKSLHIAMYPWFAIGHFTTFLGISNKLAERGHKITFFAPINTIPKIEHFNLHPDLIAFIPITLPKVLGLKDGGETTKDVPPTQYPLLMKAMDLTKPTIESFLQTLNPNIIFFDFTHWIPELTRKLGIKSVSYCIISPASVGFLLSPERNRRAKELIESDYNEPPKSFPSSSQIKLTSNEARGLVRVHKTEFGEGITFMDRLMLVFSECDAIAFKTSKEMEGSYCDYVASQYEKTVLLAGPVLPQPPTTPLEKRWAEWLESFEAKTVIFCAFGSESSLGKDQLQELVLGLELTGMPFLAALKPPMGTTEDNLFQSVLPLGGFEDRIRGRGIVHGGWVQQQQILGHPSIGCFVTHCGTSSLSEGLVSDCQLVLVPDKGDQFISARLMENEFKVGVEVEKDENGLFTRDQVCKAIKMVMEVEGGIGKEVKENHAKWRKFLLGDGLEASYVDNFIQGLQKLLV